jgi:hypothetical protein
MPNREVITTSLLHLNIRGLTNKTTQLECILSQNNNVKIVCLTEHFLKHGDYSNICIGEYILATCYSRKNSTKGGSCIFIHKTLQFLERIDFKNMSLEFEFECVSVDVTIDNLIYSIVCIYRSPIGNLDLYYDKLESIINIIYREGKIPIICGDTNIDLFLDSKVVNDFKSLLNICNLVPLISTATRICNTRSSLIDNIFVPFNIADAFKNCKTLSFPDSDHEAQICSLMHLDVDLGSQKIKFQSRKFSKTNINKFVNLLKEESWASVFAQTDIDSIFGEFHTTFLRLFEICFPLKSSNKIINSENNKNSFMTKGLKISREKLYQLKKLSKFHPSIYPPHYVNQYKKIYNNLCHLARKKSNTYIVNKAENKSKAMWNIIKTRHSKPVSNKQIQKIIYENTTLTHPQDIVNSFSNYFTNSVLQCKNIPYNIANHNTVDNIIVNEKSMFLKPFSSTEMLKIIKLLKNKRSYGFDNIPDFIVKLCAEYLCDILAYIINISFMEGKFPTKLKQAIVKPVFKKGPKDDIKNYRPISLLSVFSKIFERAYLSRLISFLECSNILSHSQHGFRKNRSTETAIFDLVDDILNSIDSGKKTAGIFLDLSKAFDTVEHDILFKKLHKYGVRGPCLDWIQSFLCSRSETVEMNYVVNNVSNNYLSNTKEVLYGIGQGTCLGPVLFLLYVNDFPLLFLNEESCSSVNYADDSNLKVTAPDNTILSEKIINIILKVKNYLAENGLQLNINKTEIVQFQNIRNKNNKVDDVIIGNEIIHLSSETKFLGLYLDENLRWTTHINFLCQKLSSVIFAIKELRHECEMECLLTLYYSNFYSHIKYGIIFWGNSIESDRVFILQKKIIRLMCFVGKYAHCTDLFKRLGVLTLPCVYLLQCLLYVKNNMSTFKKHVTYHNYNTRNLNQNITPIFCNLMMYKNGPLSHCIDIYNKLPVKLKNIDNINDFKKSIFNYLMEKCYYNLKSYFDDT